MIIFVQIVFLLQKPFNSKEHIQVEYLFSYFEETFRRYSLDIRPTISNGKPFKKFLDFNEVAPFDRNSEPMKAIVQAFVKQDKELVENPVSVRHLIMDLLTHYKNGVFKVIYPIMNLQGGNPLVAGDATSNLAFHSLSRIDDWDVSSIMEGLQNLKIHLLDQSKVEIKIKSRKQLNLK